MLILSIKTDKPEAEIGLFNDRQQLSYYKWQAHRQLAETIHQKIQKLLKENNKNLKDLEGLVVFKGPGSFTGLRIGLSVANALADSLQIPIVGQSDETWLEQGLNLLAQGHDE